MPSLIHATVTVSGDASQLAACDARIRVLLAEQAVEGDVSDHHGADALCYDLKLRGGVPFPAFVLASSEFPALTIDARWVHVDANARGAATIVNGKLVEHSIDRLGAAERTVRPALVSALEDGRLELALTFYRAARDEWLGYALTGTRDALLRLRRAPESEEVELYATAGSPEWSLCWRGSAVRADFAPVPVAAPEPIDADSCRDLERMAQEFVDEWVWFASGPATQIAIEKERYAQYGYAVAAANLRSARLHRMKSGLASPDGRLVFSTLGADETWVKDVVARCWLSGRDA